MSITRWKIETTDNDLDLKVVTYASSFEAMRKYVFSQLFAKQKEEMSALKEDFVYAKIFASNYALMYARISNPFPSEVEVCSFNNKLRFKISPCEDNNE